ncbi:VMAP-C domain-containing protein [Streptomyces sp. 8N114]|uniref:VMAP-C domain-containing protein n=1 Tax=Streptomyces sp. 8N114 TaxID=3457419 RepID=UPI003FD4DB05
MTDISSLPALDPKRVHALVVGIESYDISPHWDLPGAGRDALRVAAWLTDTAGVPASQVRLLLSPRQDCTTTSAHPYQAATQENVERTLFTELSACEGDLLWIYWAGHGFLDASDRLLLPYQNATASLTRHLNLTSALHWLRSDRLAAGHFHRQVALGDTCRVDSALARGLNFGSVSYGGGRTLPDRRQFTLYASRPGEVAQNMTDRAAGRFTDTLLARLEGKSLESVVHGLTDIAKGVQADFRLLRSKGLGWQHPEFIIDRGWDGSTIFGARWTAAGDGARSLDQTAWNQLGDLLHGRPLPPFTYEAYRWAFDVSGCVPPARRELPATELTEIARDLDRRQGGAQPLPLTLPFVRHLVAWCDDPAWAARAVSWVETTGRRLGAAPVPVPPSPPVEHPAVHIRLTADSAVGEAYWVRMWHHRQGTFETLWESARPLEMARIRAQLAEQLRGAAERCTGGADGVPTRIEFHIPYELLTEEFECWRLAIGRPGKVYELGSHYEVVLRCPDERVGVAGANWRRKWDWFKTHGGESPEATRWLRDADISATLHASLQTELTPVCALADVSERLVNAALDAVLEAGVPIAVWPRHGRSQEAAGIDRALADLDLRALPAAVRKRRALCDRRPLALMWDNPDHIPEMRSLS